jgi:hypothetical protein
LRGNRVAALGVVDDDRNANLVGNRRRRIGMAAGNVLVIGIAGAVGILIGTLSLASPALVRPIYVTASLLALPVGFVISQLLVVVMFYGIFLPVGAVFRLTGRDALERRFDREATSYWRAKAQPLSIESYFRQS